GRLDFAAFEDDELSPALELDGVGMMDLPNGQSSINTNAGIVSERSSSSESLSDKVSSELKKSFDAVVFDVLKVTPEEYAGQITLMDAPVFKAIQPECPWPVDGLQGQRRVWVPLCLCGLLSRSLNLIAKNSGRGQADSSLELSSCGWNKKEKHSSAPNAVAFTRRFNQSLRRPPLRAAGGSVCGTGRSSSGGTSHLVRGLSFSWTAVRCPSPARKAGRWRGPGTRSAAATLDAYRALLADHLSYSDRWGNPLFTHPATSFWVVREILHAQTLKIRAEVLSLYIRTAKKLCDINNLHAVMAVVSALQSAPIFRLTKTWALLSRKDKATFDRLDYLMSKEDNYKRLRDYISSQSMVSCMPYLGTKAQS
ncbi:unnamed protein product, partial [Pleuronectes platessa]